MLRSSIAIVIGPTPPGTGVISGARSARGFELYVAGEACVGAVHADVDDDGALLDPVALDQLGHADRGDQHVGAAADLGEVARARVAGGDGGVGGQQQRARSACRRGRSGRRRPPRRPRARTSWRRSSSMHAAAACTGAGPGRPLASRPVEIGVRPSTSLPGSISVGQRRAVDLRRRRELQQDAVDRRVRR